jgi:5-hydroxyisourate hydrolase
MIPPVTTHVLDTTLGRPAAGVPVTLSRYYEEQWSLIAETITNYDGRVTKWLDAIPLTRGTYRLRFDTAPYLRSQKQPVFYPWVDVVFEFDPQPGHVHIPLLLSPFGYSTYRGS